MEKITKYFKDTIAVASQETIRISLDKCIKVSNEELQVGKVDLEKCKAFLKSNSNIEVIISLKTLAPDYIEGVSQKEDKELRGLFFLPAILQNNGILETPISGKDPWIPRKYLSPMIDPEISLGNIDDYNDYIHKTITERNSINSWEDYYYYAINMFKKIIKNDYFDSVITNLEGIKFEIEDCCYLIEDNTIHSTTHIFSLYKDIIASERYNDLYNNLISPNCKVRRTRRTRISTNNGRDMKKHCGQMNSDFPLDNSQRKVLNSFNFLNDGELLTVSGPPGTGKTTLIQSIVADMMVKSALNRTTPPVIVATSSSNQAVTNIIESFVGREDLPAKNLTRKWITGTTSFATFFPSNKKMNDQNSTAYQRDNLKGERFIKQVESEENRKQSEELFKKKYKEYTGLEFCDYLKCLDILHRELNDLEFHRVDFIKEIEDYQRVIGKCSIDDYMLHLKEMTSDANSELDKLKLEIGDAQTEKSKLEERIKQWTNGYSKLPLLVRLFKNSANSKKHIKEWITSIINVEEKEYINSEMNIDDIQSAINIQIEARQKYINSKNERVQKTKLCIAEANDNKVLVEKKHQSIESKIIQLNENEKLNVTIPLGTYETDADLFMINQHLDKIRTVEFWLAVHYYECKWLSENYPLSEKQIPRSFANVLKKRYQRLAMISPCFVMTLFMLPKNFHGEDNLYLYKYIDLLIVDEAGQTSPEIAAASFNLAKKAIVIGDENQLTPVWNTTKSLDITMALNNNVIKNVDEFDKLEEIGLNCSSSSMMHLSKHASSFSEDERHEGLFLSGHRRCYDEIINYSNKLVYQNQLNLMRGSFEKDEKNQLKGILPAMGHKQITTAKSKHNGPSRYNLEEATIIINWLKENYAKLRRCYMPSGAENDNSKKGEVLGIITPFRSQKSLLEYMLTKEIPEYKDEITVGTVHTFQGSDRNIILFSSVYGSKDGCYFIQNSPELMNVAVSRAKDSFIVFGDRDCLSDNEETPDGLLKKLTECSID